MSDRDEYVGYLAGYHNVMKLPSFEEWMMQEQKRLNEKARAKEIEAQKHACNLYLTNN